MTSAFVETLNIAVIIGFYTNRKQVNLFVSLPTLLIHELKKTLL